MSAPGMSRSSAAPLARSLRAITLGTLTGYNDRHDQYVAESIGEVDRQFVLTFASTGDATDVLDGTGEPIVPYTGGIIPGDDYGSGPPGGGGEVSSSSFAVLLPSATPEPAVLAPELDPKADTKTLPEFWRTIDVTFGAPFVDGTDDRDVPFTVPVFTFGVELRTGAGIVVSASVVRWITDEDGEYVNGAQIQYGVFRPNRKPLGHFVAAIHLNFQGWATPNEPEADPEEGAT